MFSVPQMTSRIRPWPSCASFLLLITLSTVGLFAPSAVAQQKIYEFKNGRWFDGQTFEKKTLYIEGGVFSEGKPGRVDESVNLKGAHVVPPYAEGHNHNVAAGQTEIIVARYLKEGIFYVKNPGSLARERPQMEGLINTAATIDVTFANGGLTGSEGHPIQIARRNIDNGAWPEEDGEGGFYFTIDTHEDLDAKWDAILAGRPDFIKTYLLYSEEYETRKNDEAFNDWKGLDPKLLPDIVRRAHTAGLRVSTHIETAADFRNALLAQVDEINHLPGFRPQPGIPLERYELTEADARRAAEQGTFVITTLASTHPPEVRELHARNLRALKEQGVSIAIGSDAYRQTATLETSYLRRLGVFTNLELLKMWCETTPATIFPDRKIGRLADGYEASFLVLEGDPIEDFTNTKRITRRFKQGQELSLD